MKKLAIRLLLVVAALSAAAPVFGAPPARVVTVTLVRWPYT